MVQHSMMFDELCISIVCRFTFVIAFLLLLTGAALNDQHGEENIYFGSYYCYVVKPGIFAGAAILSLASVVLGILYYLTFDLNKKHKFSSLLWDNHSFLHRHPKIQFLCTRIPI